MQSGELYDLERIKSFVGDSREMAAELAELFLTTVPLLLQQLSEAYRQDDMTQVSFTAHRLKSFVDNFNISILKDPVRRIEYAGKQGNGLAAVKADLDLLHDHLGRVMEVLKQDLGIE